MRRLPLVVLIATSLSVALTAPGAGAAVNAPPGNSGVGEYVEVVPSVGGETPTGRGQAGGSGGSGGESSTGQGQGSSSNGGSDVAGSTSGGSSSTSDAGSASRAKAVADVPAIPADVRTRVERTSRDGAATLAALEASGGAGTALAPDASDNPSSGIDAVADQFAPADGGGVLLPLFLIAALGAFAVLAFRGRRSS